MTRRNLLTCLCLGLCSPTLFSAQDKAPTSPQPHAVMLIKSDKPSDWQASIKKIDELIDQAKPQKAVVELVVAGGGLKLVDKDSPMAANVIHLLERKVEVVACKTSMEMNKMPLSRLIQGVGAVPSASQEIASRKQLGWQQLESVNTVQQSN